MIKVCAYCSGKFEVEEGKCKNYCDICENPQYEYSEDKKHMDEVLEEIEKQEKQRIEKQKEKENIMNFVLLDVRA